MGKKRQEESYLKKKYLLIDFEYKGSPETHFPLVSASFHLMPEDKSYCVWLYKDKRAQRDLKKFLEKQKDRIHIAFNVSGAEALCYINLGLDAMDFEWVDLQLEWKFLINSWDRFFAGKHLVKGKVKKIPPCDKRKLSSKVLRREYGSSLAMAPDKSLAACTYGVLREKVDFFQKNKMRDLIIYTPEFSEEQKEAILNYNYSDIKDMWRLFRKIKETTYSLSLKKEDTWPIYLEEMLVRGRVSAATANVASRGYPVEIEKIKNLTKNIPLIENHLVEDIRGQGINLFKDNQSKQKRAQGFKYQKDTKLWQDLIRKSPYEKQWPRTATGKYKSGKDDIQAFYPYKYDYPRKNPYAQMIRFLSMQSNLKGFTRTKSGSFFDSVGKDGRVRPFLNPYGSQTARWQPKATGFMFLKSAWLRGLVHPKKGRMIAGIDYSSQEILVSAALSGDKELLKAYRSGDIYLYYGKKMKMLPEEATKKTHKKERDICKAAVLAISYGMGPVRLSSILTEVSGEKHTRGEALKYINGFYSVFYRYAEYRERLRATYESKIPLELPCGWKLFCDNPSLNSILNFPVQGTASTILRLAFVRCVEEQLDLLFPLHDALYCEFNLGDIEGVEKLNKIMKDASRKVLGPWGKYMRTDIDLWGEGVSSLKTPKNWNVAERYLDERGAKEYGQFKKYFER